MAIVATDGMGRLYLPPTAEQEDAAHRAKPTWRPDVEFFQRALGFRLGNYGMRTWSDLFTERQLVALTTFSGLIAEAMNCVHRDSLAATPSNEGQPLRDGGVGAAAYAQAIGVYLALAVDKAAEGSTRQCTWSSLPSKLHVVSTFGRQALPMTWDYAEANVFADSSGNLLRMCELVANVIDRQCSTPVSQGLAQQGDAARLQLSTARVLSTDPPYYDNIGYADLSDFFYVWLRRALRSVFPELFSTLVVPKSEELVATPARHGGREKAEQFFLDGMTQAMNRLASNTHPAFAVTIYYAFKQSESDGEDGVASTGWETFLDAVICAGFAVSGTWPIRTERSGGFRNRARSSLASSIVLVCRPCVADASFATRREFVAALKAELPRALGHLQRGNIAPVDLAQAAIGPGMGVYTRYSKVLDADGKPLSVREALALINQTLDEALTEQEGDFDADSRWALAWFEQHGFGEGEFGVADVLARAKNTSVQGLVDAGILKSSRGDVRLLKPSELAANWDPSTDPRLSAWESVHQLIRALESGGEAASAELVAKLGSKAELARELCYRLYTLCERKKRAAEALSYNGLVQSFPELERLAKEPGRMAPAQASILAGDEE